MGRTQSLMREGHVLAGAPSQRLALESDALPSFDAKLAQADMYPLRAGVVDILQINVGKVCNQTCAHCHVDAAPDRKESMSREIFEQCLYVIAANDIPIIDITGGAPELNPHFRWFVESVSALGRRIMVRCNLTIIVSNPKYHDLPSFYARHNVEVVASLPFYSASRTDAQRGEGVYEASIRALALLNDVGYGKPDSGRLLNLVYNPAGAFLPADQAGLEAQFKRELRAKHSVEFNQLFCIANMPISRYLEYLIRTGNYESYMRRLVEAFNPAAVAGVMCRNTLSVAWDGRLFDCDFNQMLEMSPNGPSHIKDFDSDRLRGREIATGRHCFGCTAGSGSSCGGATV
ncbi:MAG: arsenosugar biosynthesis radical SAM protein ArsS [Leptospirales bacterium]|nr:arsenosugar biosynthesis radical SAM protein ArsS [Leptospirales bacterium]